MLGVVAKQVQKKNCTPQIVRGLQPLSDNFEIVAFVTVNVTQVGPEKIVPKIRKILHLH